MITNDIIVYIENEVKRGVSHEAISEALVAAGWKSLEVADALRVVSERALSGATGTPYVPVAAEMLPARESINQNAVKETLEAKAPTAAGGMVNPESQIHIAPFVPQTAEDRLPIGGLIPNSNIAVPEAAITETSSEKIADKPEHHRLLPVLIVFGVIVLGVASYFFLSPIINNPSKKIANVSSVVEGAKSVQYSGEYEVNAPAGLVLPDKILISNFGGTAARQSNATMKGAFMGVDDWFDYKSKKNEVKFITKINVGSGTSIDFTSTSRLINNALYVKLSESMAMFDDVVANQGANWVRVDDGMQVPNYAYGFWGNANLYTQGFPRALARYIATATPGEIQKDVDGSTTISVRYDDSLVMYFNSIFNTGDKLGISGSLGSKYPATSLTELPTGQITIGGDGVIKKATFGFAYKTKEYALPVRIRFSLSLDRFNAPPTINVPSLVIPFANLSKGDSSSTLPEGLQGFFGDIRTIASVYKGSNTNSYKGVCIKKGEQSDESTELTIPFISDKIVATGYELPTCADTDTAWSYYTRDTSGYYCTDSRGFSGKAARQPLGDKCN